MSGPLRHARRWRLSSGGGRGSRGEPTSPSARCSRGNSRWLPDDLTGGRRLWRKGCRGALRAGPPRRRWGFDRAHVDLLGLPPPGVHVLCRRRVASGRDARLRFGVPAPDRVQIPDCEVLAGRDVRPALAVLNFPDGLSSGGHVNPCRRHPRAVAAGMSEMCGKWSEAARSAAACAARGVRSPGTLHSSVGLDAADAAGRRVPLDQ